MGVKEFGKRLVQKMLLMQKSERLWPVIITDKGKGDQSSHPSPPHQVEGLKLSMVGEGGSKRLGASSLLRV